MVLGIRKGYCMRCGKYCGDLLINGLCSNCIRYRIELQEVKDG